MNALLQQAGKGSAPVQVKGTLNDRVAFETNVVRYSGAYRLYLNTQMRKEAGVGVGDTVRIALDYDPGQRMPPMPELLRAALNEDPRAKERWRLQSSSRRKEILAYLNSLKTEETVRRRVGEIIRVLLKAGSDGSSSTTTLR